MKVAITGHTNGIGLGLHNYFVDRGHQVLGFSRSNGYTMPGANDRILSQIIDCDLFVNNCEPVHSQIFFLQQLWPLWWDKPKTMIIIGSVLAKLASDHPEFRYAQIEKQLLDVETRKVTYDMKPGRKLAITAIHPSYVKTNLHSEYGIPDADDSVTLSVQQIVDVVDMVLKSPIVIEEIVFRKP